MGDLVRFFLAARTDLVSQILAAFIFYLFIVALPLTSHYLHLLADLDHLTLDRMAVISDDISIAFSSMKSFVFEFEFHRRLFLRV